MEKYKAPEVLTFGELDFEPAVNGTDGTFVTCEGIIGACTTQVVVDS